MSSNSSVACRGAGGAAIPRDTDDDDLFAALSDEQRQQLTDLLKTLPNRWIDRMDWPHAPRAVFSCNHNAPDVSGVQ